MKRVFSLALAALLLAGCTATPATEESKSAGTSTTAETPAADTTSDSGGKTLRPLYAGDEKQYYMYEIVSDELIRYRVADLVNHVTDVPCDVEGCTHDSESCPAVFRRGECDLVFVLDDNALVAFTNNGFPSEEDTQVVLLDRDCQNRRTVANVENAAFVALGGEAGGFPYTDGQYLYCFGYKNGFGEQNSLFRIDTANGEVTDLLENAPVQGLLLMGALDQYFVFFQSDVTYTDPVTDPTATGTEVIATGTTTHWLFNPYTDEWKVFQTYSSDDGSLDRMYSIIIDGQYYQIDREVGSVSVVAPDTGEAKLITDQYPVDQLQSHLIIQDKVQDWLLFYESPMVNLETGEIRQKPSLPENYWNGSSHQPNIYLNLGDTLLVDCRYEPYTRTTIGSDGTPYTVDTEHKYLGLISTEDFLNGVPNYTEVGEYTT